ncbi:MAG TPA: biotin--[acetyl-CoA-carboxylase] ligase [Actinomycetes bacterium]|nr:biotin--[acetyl-CoA-carboxylase] ligase [Actinomycetes bacterium]
MTPSSNETTRDPLDRDGLADQIITPGSLWTSVEVVESLTSTNEVMARRAEAGEAGRGAVLVAEEQTAGRGRRGRSWTAPPRSSVTASALVTPTGERTTWGWIPLLTSLALSDAVETLGVSASVKWPNDLVVGSAKLAGVLCEVVTTPVGPSIVVGFGINVCQTTDELPQPDATSLLLCGGSTDRARLLTESLRSFERWYGRWSGGDERVMAEYVERSSTLGSDVVASIPDGTVLNGRAVRIDANGNLVLEVGGAERQVVAADVVHLRPTRLPP